MSFPIIKNKIFVFGSNQSGIHGAGAARDAVMHYGAIPGKGIGHHGNSYAIPTKDYGIRTMPINHIRPYVESFIRYASKNPQLEFYITPIGTGLAGYTHEQIAPLFKNAPANCQLPEEWKGLCS